jgi:hypothetical protein
VHYIARLAIFQLIPFKNLLKIVRSSIRVVSRKNSSHVSRIYERALLTDGKSRWHCNWSIVVWDEATDVRVKVATAVWCCTVLTKKYRRVQQTFDIWCQRVHILHEYQLVENSLTRLRYTGGRNHLTYDVAFAEPFFSRHVNIYKEDFQRNLFVSHFAIVIMFFKCQL